MKIYFITSKLNFRKAGGSVEEIDYIIRNLINLGHQVTVVTAFSKNNDIPDPLPYPLKEEFFTSRGLVGMQVEVFNVLKKYSKEADFFLIDAHNFMYGAGMYRLLRGRVPVGGFVNQFLTCWQPYISSFFPQTKEGIFTKTKKKVRWLIEKHIGLRFANRVDIFAYVSPTLRKTYEDFGMRKSERDFVIGDPIDMKLLMEAAGVSQTAYRDRTPHPGPILLFFSSRISPGKGFDMFLQGFSRVQNKDDFRVILGGTGPEAVFAAQMVKDLELEKYVTLPGWVSKEQLFAYYREADIFIQADWWVAGTSISLLYALAFGLPSILPGGGGLQWNAGGGALYFPYRDPDALARRIEELGADPELRAKISASCYERLAMPDMDYPALIAEFAGKLEAIKSKN